MGKKSRSKKTRESESKAVALRPSPNWPLLALSIAGMLLTGYLSYTSLTGGAVKGCSAGGGCDIVLNSRWSTMFGLPTALWGFFAYAGIAGIAFIKGVEKHWRYAWITALLGLAFSVYLTTVSMTVLKAACPYCLTSLALMTAIFALTTYQRPAEIRNFDWRRWLTWRIPAAALFVFLLHLQYVAVPFVPESPMARPLADHLSKIGAKMYGAYWCEHCQQQKRYFGKSADRLPYIECSPGGPGTGVTSVCRENAISTFPTWVVKDRRVEGVLTLTELAEMSGYQATTSSP